MTRTRHVVALAAVVLVAAVAVLLPGVARAATAPPTVEGISKQVMCPTCETTLDRSESPAASRMRVLIQKEVAAGKSQHQILADLVQQYGGDEHILAKPPTHGYGLLVWLVPSGVFLVLLGFGAVTLRGWRRTRDQRTASETA